MMAYSPQSSRNANHTHRALGKNKKAKTAFEAFSTTNKRDYNQWLTEAKTDATRKRRLETAIEWMAEGKDRNWKYR